MLDNVKLHWPKHKEGIWEYSVYLGPFEDEEKRVYDLGVYVHPDGEVSAAIAYGPEADQYISGNLADNWEHAAVKETRRRAEICGLLRF